MARASDARAQIGLDPDPAWAVVATVPPGNQRTLATDGVRYLLVSDQVNLQGPSPVWHRRLVYEVDQQRGLASAGQFTIEFQPEYQRVQLHAVDVWRDGVRQDRRAQSRIEMLRRESDLEAGLLDGQHTLSVTIPDLRVGDRVDYRFSIVGFNPVFGSDYHDVYSAGYSMPVEERRVRFVYPRSVALRWRVSGSGYEVRKSGQGTEQVLDIAARGLRRIKEEETTPVAYDPYGKIQFSTAADWKAVAQWASPLYPSRFADRKLAAELVRKLVIEPSDKEGSLLRSIAFVQGEIRYTGLDMGQNSHAPNPPELTLARRFGDCKDKASLLVALLAEAGIRAEPVLVHTAKGGAVRNDLPSPLAFNHVVVRARHGGHDLWIDPTRDRERGALAQREPLPFAAGLPVHDPAGRLVRIPRAVPDHPLVDVDQHIALQVSDDAMAALFKVATTYSQGPAADVRDNFASNGAEEVGRQYLEYMRRFYDDIESVSPPDITDADARERARTTESYRLDWDPGDASNFGIVLFQLSDWLPTLDAKERRDPLALSGARVGRQVIRTTLPGGWSIAPEHAKVANPYFSFERSVRVVGKDLVVEGRWRRLADAVPASDYALVRRDFAKARDLLTFEVDLAPQLPTLLSDFAAWRWPLVALLALLAALATAWRLRDRSAFAGMLFHPGRTMSAIEAGPAWKVATLVLLAGLIGTLCDLGAEYMHAREPVKLAAAVVGIGGFALRLAVAIVLLRWALKLLSVRADFRKLYAAGAWGSSPPFLVLMACALVAVGGNIVVFAEEHVAAASERPGIVVAGGMAVVAIWWMLVSSANALAVVADTTRGRVAMAMGLVAAAVSVVLVPIVLFAYSN